MNMTARFLTREQNLLLTDVKSVDSTGSNLSKTASCTLCTTCSELQLDELLKGILPPLDPNVPFGKIIASVGKYYCQPSDPACDLCHMLSESRLSSEDGPTGDVDYLGVFGVLRHCKSINLNFTCDPAYQHLRYGMLRGQESLFLSVVPRSQQNTAFSLRDQAEDRGFLVARRCGSSLPDVFAAREVSAQFDAALATSWLDYCRCHHSQVCERSKSPTKGLCLIDCHSREIAPASSEARYTALSYVWGVSAKMSHGSATRNDSGGLQLPAVLPAVVSDAIKVTMDMGFRYLWVDQYCIDQHDEPVKQDQISQMDTIYENAELTIIAAAGDHPNYGLPGVGTRPRNRQQAVTIGSLEIVSTMRHPHASIKASKWFKRAWTFQEAVLSRRRLVFTVEQAYFECNAMNCQESFSSTLDKLHTEDKSKFHNFIRPGIFSEAKTAISPAASLSRFKRLVEQYTPRDMTYDTDSLNAFAGIMRRFESSDNIRQVWGIPLGPQSESSFVEGLTWYHPPSRLNQPRRRRSGFPSWSWAAWCGAVEYASHSVEGDATNFKDMTQSVVLQLGDGSPLGVAYYLNRRFLVEDPSSGNVLGIEAVVLPSSAFSYGTPLGQEHHQGPSTPSLLVFGLETRVGLSTAPLYPKSYQIYQSLIHEEFRQCIYVGSVGLDAIFMVLEVRDTLWSRIGLLTVKNGADESLWRDDFYPEKKTRTSRVIKKFWII